MKPVNEELDTDNVAHQENRDILDAELNEVNSRLAKLYDALETGKLDLDDLAPRIKGIKGATGRNL